ncbi:MAG: energy transducer TonB [Gemmatimonadaceae bacterium]|nr:energy transducer TonB [Gemmatimonadaceae bacterium]
MLLLAASAHAQSLAMQSSRIAGCWRADRPLGPTGGVEPVARDSAFRTFVLQDSGRVALPTIPDRWRRLGWEERSSWTVRRDSVRLRVFTGLQGWDAQLVFASNGQSLHGVAQYLTDVIAVGMAPLLVPAVLARITCEASWPSVATTARALRPWQTGEPLFMERQVDRPAALASALVGGIVASRPLGYDERAKLDSSGARAGIARVVLQFVVESDGRVDVGSVKVLASDGDEFTTRVMQLLGAWRFTPAMRRGVAVHQLVYQRFEVRR